MFGLTIHTHYSATVQFGDDTFLMVNGEPVAHRAYDTDYYMVNLDKLSEHDQAVVKDWIGEYYLPKTKIISDAQMNDYVNAYVRNNP